MQDILALAGRAGLAALFIWAGFGKLMDPTGTMQLIASMNVPLPIPVSVIYYVAVVIELGGGIALLLGIPAQSIAVILAAWSIATGIAVHLPMGDRVNMINFYKNLSIAGGLLYVTAFGPGALAIGAGRRI
ncbi:MAG TPA: DoxX family protein [Acidisphaera sp.]|nr:DoxX family protein [Acidisphaera sp.]